MIAPLARFLEAMDDDFNTGGAMGVLIEFLRTLNKFCDDEKLEEPAKPSPDKIGALKQATTVLRELTLTFGLFRQPVAEKAAAGQDALVGKLMELLIQMRAAARKKKDFAMADTIRSRLTEIGIVLEDRPGGT